MEMQDVRRMNLAAWVKQHGGHTVASKRAGLKQSEAAYLSACINGYSLGERSARNWERKLKLPAFSLDKLTALEEHTPADPGANQGGVDQVLSYRAATLVPTFS